MQLSFSMLSDPEVMGMLATGVAVTLRLFVGALACGFGVALLL
jgi:polar amino acid transport system permease protein